MAKTKKLSESLNDLPVMGSTSSVGIPNISIAGLELMSQLRLQEMAFRPRVSPNGINLDTDRVPGIFSLYSCTGTKPTDYGMAINIMGVGNSDIYQLVIGYNGYLYTRSISGNNAVKKWTRHCTDATYTPPMAVDEIGGGKRLAFSKLRNLAERRVA